MSAPASVAANKGATTYLPLFITLILLSTYFVYLPGLSGGFLFDDSHTIIENGYIHADTLTLESLRQAAGSFAAGGRQISMASFFLNSYFLEAAPYSFKLVNLIVHLLNGLLIYFLTRLLLQSYADNLGRLKLPDWTPVAITAAWLLNPMELTTVLYVVQRMTGLASFFILGGLLAYAYGRQRQMQGKHGMAFIISGLLGGTALAYLSKENGVLLVPFALLIEVIFYRFRKQGSGRDWRIIWLVVILPLSGFLFLLFTYYSPHRFLTGYASRDFSLHERLLTESRVIWLYIRLILLPDNRLFGIWHDDISVSESLLSPPNTLLAVTGIILLFTASIFLLRKAPLIAFGILWFFVAHSIESTVLPLEIAHEHRNYLASYGILFTLITTIVLLLQSNKNYKLAGIVIVTIIIAYAYVTFERSRIWANPLQHSILEAENHPESARAVFEAGRQLLVLSVDGNEDLQELGFSYWQKAAQLDKTGITPELSMIITAENLGIAQDPEWMVSATHKLAEYPLSKTDLRALNEFLKCLESQQCHLQTDKTTRLFKLAAKGNNPQGLTLLGFYTANILKRYTPAEKAFAAAVHRKPNEPAYRVNYARILIAGRAWSKALVQLDHAESIDPFKIHQSAILELREIINQERMAQ